MQSLFIQILNMSITGSIIILFVLAARLILRKAPKIYSYILWLIPFFRLICPFSIESIYSLIPVNSQPIPQDIAMAQIPEIDTGIAAVNNAVNTSLPAPAPTASVNPMQIWLTIGEGLWLLGIAVMVLYTLISYIILLVRLYESSGHTGGGIYIADNIEIPFVMGIFKPRIYIPSGLSRDEREFIILHERTHIKRHDYIFKLIGWIILTIHWFNPLVHLAYRLMEKDMEMSCDEAVISKAEGDIKKAYSSSLLYFSQAKYKNRLPVAFGLCDIKSRVKNILSYKKPPVIIAAVLVVAVGIFGAVCMISPEREIQQTTFPIYDTAFNGKWKITDYCGIATEPYTADINNISNKKIEYFNSIFIGKQMEINDSTVLWVSPPSELGFEYDQLTDFYGTSVIFPELNFDGKIRYENICIKGIENYETDIISDMRDNTYLWINSIYFYRLEKIS